MIVISYFDWFGTPEDLEKLKEAWTKACEEAEGVKSTKLYTSHQARYHYAWITKTESYDKLSEAWMKMPPRDRNVMTHAVTEIFTKM